MKLYSLLSLLFLGVLWRSEGVASSSNDDVGRLINVTTFNAMFKYQKDPQCPSQGFYSYQAFLTAARSFGKLGFATTGKLATRKRELLAFLAQTSHQTTGGWLTAPEGPLFWGYCHIRESTEDSYCKADPKWPCAKGQKYYGRGPMQLKGNQNYGQAGKALGLDLLKNPDLVAKDPVVSFKTAIWFWMTAQGIKPSCHDVMVGKWKPTEADKAAKRVPGYGVVSNIIGGSECGSGANTDVADRFGFYVRYCKMLGANPGKHLDCFFQQPFTRM
ncbi:chitinase 2 [Cucumis melo var. makuwa]|uniref:Chitinase 2 n=2 Tax=Cucumis melo TaxID=3656 RepID=A0A5A7SLP3_CUCMM|nr:endochitinase-like [Cucumis melo]KAA0025617.1 chitinase 2 [Cucumis melo var. makuwa]TYK12492.1 chitinase 2 [Cucumis melo var. makuwa]